jgi:hypothetical protein
MAMTRIELKSKVGPDGVLNIVVPVGMDEANQEVRVTVESAGLAKENYKALITTYGSCADLGLVEPADLPLQERDLL